MPTDGRSSPRRIGPRSTGSGMNHSATAPAANPISNSTKTRRDGAGPYWTSAPATRAPSAWPEVGPPVVTTDASGRPDGCRSSSAALSAPVASPVAKPCTARAAKSHPTPSAPANTAIATISTTALPSSTGRRPIVSDSGPEGLLTAVESLCPPSASLHVERFHPRDTGIDPAADEPFEVLLRSTRSG